VAEVEADPGVGLPSDIAEDGQLEPRVLVADVLDDDLDARVAAGVGDPPGCSAATSRNSVSSRSAEVAWRTAFSAPNSPAASKSRRW